MLLHFCALPVGSGRVVWGKQRYENEREEKKGHEMLMQMIQLPLHSDSKWDASNILGAKARFLKDLERLQKVKYIKTNIHMLISLIVRSFFALGRFYVR